MSKKQSKLAKQKLPWQSQNSSYQENSRAIRLAHQSFIKNTPISLESEFDEKQSRIIRQSIRISEMARNAEPLERSSNGQPPNISEFILNDFRVEDEKYGVFESASEHSSQDETEVKVTTDEIEDIVVSVKKDPQNGKITFISKLVNANKANVEYRVVKVKSIGNFIPKVQQTRSYGHFTLYEIETNSFLKKIAVELVVDGKAIAKSREISFNPRLILFDLELSYNLDRKYDIRINYLEGLLASCVLEGQKFVEEILQLTGRRELKTKIMSERFTVDEETRRLIKQNKYSVPILKLLKLLIEEERWSLGVASDNITNPAYQALVQIFIEEMLKFKPTVGREERQEITIGESVMLVELYIHFICLAELQTKGISISSFEKQAQEKLDEFIHFIFQVPQMRIYHKFIQLCIMKQLSLLPQGYDTIKDYITNYNLNSSEYILTHLQNIFYTLNVRKVKANPIKLFLDAFKDKKFESNNIYDKQMPDIMKLSKALFSAMDIASLSFEEFITLFKTYWNFRENRQLISIVNQPALIEKIKTYMSYVAFKSKFEKSSEIQKSLAIQTIELYYITMKDEALEPDEESLKNFVQFLIEKSTSKSIEIIIRLYFQIFKRGKRVFTIDLIRNLSNSVSKYLLRSQASIALTLLGKYFSEDYLESQELTTICNQNLLKSIILKLIPDGNPKKILDEAKLNHAKWHNHFKYPNHFNEQILEKMTRLVQKHFGTDNLGKNSYLDQIKREIEREVEDEEKRSSLLAIIQYDLLILEVPFVWEYLTEKRGYLKILIKILKREEEASSETLRESLKNIQHQIETKQVEFYKIQRLKSMKPNEWNNFVLLTDDYGIPKLVNKIFEEGNAYLSYLKKLQNFVRDVGARFTCPDYDDLCVRLQKLTEKYVKNSIRQSSIQQLAIFRGFKYEILTCYRLKPFFAGENLSNKPIEHIIKACGGLVEKLEKKIKEVYDNFENKTIKSESFYYFQPKKDDVKEFRNILLMNQKEENPKNLEDIVNIYTIIAEADENFKLLHAFVVLVRQKFDIKFDEIINFTRMCSQFKTSTSIPVHDIQQKFNIVHSKLKQFKLNFREHKQFFEVLANLTENAEKIPFFMTIEKELKDIKDEVNESGGDIQYEQIEDCQAAIEFLRYVYNVDSTFPQFISAYFAFVDRKKKISKQFNLGEVLKTAFFIIPQLKELKANMQDTNRSAVKFIDEVIKRVRFQFKNDDKNRDRVVTLITIYPEGKERSIDEREVYLNKEKAIMISSTMDENQRLQRKKEINHFLEIVKVYQQMKEQQIKLTEWGNRQFEEESIVVEIVNSDITPARQIISNRETQLTTWKKEIKKLYEVNFKAAHLQGKKFREFYDFITTPHVAQIPNYFLVIVDNIDIHRKILAEMNANVAIYKNRSLSTISSYFQVLKTVVKEEPAHDRDQNFLHFLKMPKGEVDFIKGIQQIGSDRIQKLKFEQMLICTPETSKFQIKSFIERALRDLDSQYIVLGFQNLDRRKQQFIVDQIKTYKAENGNESLKLKLCLIGDSQLQLLYKFAVEELNKSPQKFENIQTVAKAYEKKLIEECNKVKIVYSSAAGLGKSRFIKVNSFETYQCTEQYFLPLSGIMAVPVESIDENNNSIITNETEKFLWDRFEEAMNYFNEAQKANKKTCLVIQLYNIEPTVADIINKFLQNIIFFKAHKYRNNNGKLPKDLPIYIELENVSLPAYAKLNDKNTNEQPQMRMLSFLREIKSVCGIKIIKHIEEFQVSHIKIANEDKQLNYILYHLKLLKSGDINKTAILPFGEYKLQPMPQEEAARLINQYFFDQFGIKDKPSGYLWTYFRSLLLQASRNFSTSYFLQIASIAETDSNVKQVNKQLHQSMKLKQSFRSEFYKIIHRNCIQFIQRSVKPGSQDGDNAFNETLKNLPFLIIPNIDGQSFSFIYNNSANVPPVIKSMIVLQTPSLLNRTNVIGIDKLFEEQNLAAYQKSANNKQWVERASQILSNISGNRNYKIDCEKGYIVNIDNFFKMCLIVQRMRLNIPIVIMGQAGIGKTALLRHVVHHLFQHEFAVYNINAGIPLESKKKLNAQKVNESLAMIVQNIKELYQKIQAQNASLEPNDKKNAKKLWVFFDEFNTLRELGFFKEIIVDGRYLGREQPHIKNVVMMAACNPHKKLELNMKQKQQQYVREQKQRLAFDVLPAPHSLIECMWNYGALTAYEYEKYINKMLVEVRFQSDKITSTVLKIHQIIGKLTFSSAVSLRDIDRFRQLYRWFNLNLPRQIKIRIPPELGAYNNIQQRAFILSCYFTYILRFDQFIRTQIEQQIQTMFGYKKGYILTAKETEEEDLCSRLNFDWDAPIARNASLKENIYSCFVCINTRLPLLIIGAPGCSKSLSLRILAKNLKEKSSDQYISKFKRIRQYPLQGSENTTTEDIKIVFEKAYKDLLSKNGEVKSREQMKQISIVVFDEIGLAEKSKDNPLKVLHPYLEVSRQQNLDERMLSFIGISNSQLDVSKMSRLLVLRRPHAHLKDLTFTAKSIAAGYRYGNEQKIKYLIQTMTKVYDKFLTQWRAKGTNYPLFYGLRDFYGLIKIFMSRLIQKQVDIEIDEDVIECACESIFENFNGWQGTYKTFKDEFYELINYIAPVPIPTMQETLHSVLVTLDKESFRYPLVIVDDHESLCFVKWMIEKRYPNKSAYMEGSPFVEEKEYSLKLLGQVCKYMDHECVLILSNLSQGVKTGLYDFFNKSFTIRASNNNKYLKIRTQEGSLNQIQYLYHEKFNCVYLLLEKDLQYVEPPFLSRFQKYRFSLTQYRQQLSVNVLSKVERFIVKIEQICKNNKMEHIKFTDMFININKPAMESLAVAAFEAAGEEGAYQEALKRLIMNSGQYFFKIYKHYIEPNGDLPQIKEIMNEAIESKNNGVGNRNLIIRFTNDKDYTKKFSDKSIVSAQFVTFKKEADFDEELSRFFKSTTKKTLYISLTVLNESIYLNYVTSQIEKARKRAIAQNEKIEEKKIRLLYIFDKEKDDASSDQIAITHFTGYNQEYDDGRLDELKNINKKQLFNNVITIESLLNYVHQAFDFVFEGIENPIKAQTIFSRMTQLLYKKKDGLLCKKAEDITLFLEPNIEMGEEVIKQMLLDQQITKKYKNYREALTKYFADRKLLGALAVFMRYLFEKQSFMALSSDELLQYYRQVEKCTFDAEIETMIIEAKTKSDSNYNRVIDELIDSKKQFIANDYRTLKQTRRLPTSDKKFTVRILKPRLVPFSKSESEVILNYNEKEIAWYAKQIYVYDEKQDKESFQGAMKTYEDEFKKKTRFIINNTKNLYTTYINEDKNLKTMLMLDILSDFCEQKGLSYKYLGRYFKILSQFFTAEAKDNKKDNKGDRTLAFSKMVCILIGYEDIWVQIFKICQTLGDDEFEFGMELQSRAATRDSIKRYVEKIYTYLQRLLLGANILNTFKNPEVYTTIFINILFHLQKLQQLVNAPIPDKLKSTRTALVFVEMFDVSSKRKHIQEFMKSKSKIHATSYYYDMYNYFESLKDSTNNKEQKEKITQFEANQLFYEWFKQEPRNQECLRLFIQNCNNETFVHYSVATINLFISISNIDNYRSVQDTFRTLSECRQANVCQQLRKLGDDVKSKGFRNNLSILITNIFIQKISTAFKNQSLIVNGDKKFENILNKIINSEGSGIGTLFAFAYFKVYLKEYITKLVNRQGSFTMSHIDELLSKDNIFCKNLKFYCLKLMRTLKPIKQIKQEYIKVKTVRWIEALTNLFDEQPSRSIFVPNEKNTQVSAAMVEIMTAIMESHGGDFNLIDRLINEANTPYNRYALFNFFMRYYFSMSYNEKLYKNGIRQKLLASRAQYTQKIGKYQFELILKYAQSKFDENLKVDSAADFKEDLFVYFNSLNWLLASRKSISPFHSLFFREGQWHNDFKASFANLFFPCGPQSNFIGIAGGIIQLTRNNNIGVYICSGQCDYIYCHMNCGWPNESSTCQICGKGIGCIPGRGHTINRHEEGARRVMSPKLQDKGGSFYLSSLSSLTNFWEMQRNYIQAEINRMKLASVITVGAHQIKLTGYNVENNGRVSTLSYYNFRQNLNTIFYCLLGLGVFSQEQCAAIFSGKNIVAAKAFLYEESRSDIKNIKQALNLDQKFYGWMFGMHKSIYSTLINFQSEFARYISSIKEASQLQARVLEKEIADKKVGQVYSELYLDMAAAMRRGLLTKELEATFDMTAANRFTRDFLQTKVESFVKAYTTADKFAFAEENASLQGKMQFPRDVLLTEDSIDEEQYQFSRILKIPDREIKYNQIIINYELSIREHYPFLDYILKNSEQIGSMADFYNVLAFSNELAKEVEYSYERKDSNRSLKSFIDELKEKKEDRVNPILRNPEIIIASWNKLANRLDVLQNECTIVGKMNNQFSVDTPIQAFLLDNSTKENQNGLTLSSLFHNFAKMHNQLVMLLNAKKNQIPQFRCLNLYNESKRVHPQKLQESDVFMITQKQLEEHLYQNSISSINYGKNFIFNNFDTYQQYFLMKLLGKCEFISEIKKFKSICYNGEAFAQTSESSNTLTEVREYFYQELTREEVRELQGFVSSQGNQQKVEEYVVKLRGDLQRIMVAIRNLNGIIEAKNLQNFIEKLGLDEVTYELKSNTFGKFSVAKIVNFYEELELLLKPVVIQRLPVRYKEIMDQQTERQIRALLNELPLEDEYRVTLTEFGYALYRFIARILQGGVQQNDKVLMEFLPYRNDFWPKDFEEYKLQQLMNNQKMSTLTFAFAGHLFDITEDLIKRKVGVSRI